MMSQFHKHTEFHFLTWKRGGFDEEEDAVASTSILSAILTQCLAEVACVSGAGSLRSLECFYGLLPLSRACDALQHLHNYQHLASLPRAQHTSSRTARQPASSARPFPAPPCFLLRRAPSLELSTARKTELVRARCTCQGCSEPTHTQSAGTGAPAEQQKFLGHASRHSAKSEPHCALPLVTVLSAARRKHARARS